MSRNSDTPVALVTGAARRVGRSVALELARAGHDVVVHYHRSEEQARQTVDAVEKLGARALAVQGDLADPQTPDRVAEQALQLGGRIDVLVNNASVFEKMPIEQFDVERWHVCLQVNLAAPLQLCRAVISGMRRHGSGCIVNFSDISVARPWKEYLAYGPSKAGLDYATRALARALAPEIRVNAVAPGIAVFPEHYPTELRDKLVARVPLKRPGTPEDMARAVRFLVENDYITGQIINIDGGRSIA